MLKSYYSIIIFVTRSFFRIHSSLYFHENQQQSLYIIRDFHMKEVGKKKTFVYPSNACSSTLLYEENLYICWLLHMENVIIY